MSILLFSLRGVPDDEAEEVRALLTEQDIDFYETPAGNWGVSMPALWLRDDTDLEKARGLLNDYQEQRFLTQRALYLQRKQAGETKTLWQAFLEKPLLCIGYLFVIGMVLYVSVRLLFDFGL